MKDISEELDVKITKNRKELVTVIDKIIKENKILKDRWQQLKQFVEDDIENNKWYFRKYNEKVYETYVQAEEYILDEIERLEG